MSIFKKNPDSPSQIPLPPDNNSGSVENQMFNAIQNNRDSLGVPSLLSKRLIARRARWRARRAFGG